MKKIVCFFFVAAFFAVNQGFAVEIVPKPVSLVEAGISVQLPKTLTFSTRTPELKNLVSVWGGEYVPIAGVQETKKRRSADVLLLIDGTLESEEYRLVVAEAQNKVVIKGGSAAGVWWGMQTLVQILVQSRTDSGFNVPCLTISDKPLFHYRGVMLDSGRRFFPVDEVKQLIDIIALHKANVFHWHLTEDQGWKIEIKKYPLLTEKGQGIRSKGFYTQEQIRDVVKYAADRQITVVPEIEMPGHVYAALACYPELGCRGEGYEITRKGGIFKDILCAGNDKALEFLKDVFDEVCELFPSEYIHIGGDEAPVARWEECPKCQAKKAELGFEKTQYLHGYMLREIEKYLNAKGRKIIGWDEILDADVSQSAVVMAWRGRKNYGVRAAKEGYNTILATNTHFYFDRYQTSNPEANGEPHAFNRYLPFSMTYLVDPFEELNEDEKKYIMGIQASLWTSTYTSFRHAQQMMLPRCCGFSEVAWGSRQEDFAVFRQRVLDVMVPLYDALGLNYAKYGFDE